MLLRPIVLIAIAALVVNDHVLKGVGPSLITGKLSDFAGLFFFPILVFVVVRPITSRVGLSDRLSLATVVVAVGAAFAAVQLVPEGASAYELLWGVMRAPWRVLDGEPLARVQVWPDATDLIALISLWVSWRVGSRFLAGPSEHRGSPQPT